MMIATTTLQLSAVQFEAINVSLRGINTALQDKPFFDSQGFAAMAGVVGTLVVTFLSVYVPRFLDRPKIRLKVSHIFILPSPMSRGDERGISIEVSNRGKGAVTLKRVSLKFKNGDSFFFRGNDVLGGAIGLPLALGGEHPVFSLEILAGGLVEAIQERGEYPTEAFCEDVFGNVMARRKLEVSFWNVLTKS